jgi:hypothetical protein
VTLLALLADKTMNFIAHHVEIGPDRWMEAGVIHAHLPGLDTRLHQVVPMLSFASKVQNALLD